MLRHRPRTIQYRFFGHVYGDAPATNIFGSVSIAMPRISAPGRRAVCARKCFALALTYMLAATTRLAGVGRWYIEHLNALTFGFVGDVLAKLVKAPAIMQSSLTPTKSTVDAAFIRRLTNAFKFFETNRFAFLFCFSNQCFSNCVVDNLGGSAFPTGNTLQNPLSTSAAFSLQRSTGFLTRFAKRVQGFAFVAIPIRIGCYVSNAQVNSQHILTQLLLRVWYLAGSVQVKLSFDIAKVAFSLLVLQQLSMMLTCQVGYFLTGLLPSKPRQYVCQNANSESGHHSQ